MTTAAQEEFNDLVAKNTERETTHPEDRNDPDRKASDDLSEEDAYRNQQINDAMRAPTNSGSVALRLPPASFDSGRYTGVKGVIADARDFIETTHQSKWKSPFQAARRSIFGLEGAAQVKPPPPSDDDASNHSDEDGFLKEWRERRFQEMESSANKEIRNRRTSPSFKAYGTLDEVDALGYLDAIEKVGKHTTVVVYIYDHESEVCRLFESTLYKLVRSYPQVHFVKVHFEEFEFERAATPSVLAYRNQGELVANMTDIISMFPNDDQLSEDSLKKLFMEQNVI